MGSRVTKEDEVLSDARAAGRRDEPAPSMWRDHALALAKAVAAEPHAAVGLALSRALAALGDGVWSEAEIQARSAQRLALTSPLPLRIIALAREGAGDLSGAVDAYQAALALDPASVELLSDLARLAQALGLDEVSAAFLARALEVAPESAVVATQLACALLELRRFDEAVDLLSRALKTNPDDAALWNALGSALVKFGDTEQGLSFLEQALALAPDWSEAIYNRAIAKLDLGDLAGCLNACDQMLADPGFDRKAAAQFLRAQARLASGNLEGGWRDYEARLSPDLATAPIFHMPGRRWTPQTPLESERLLVVAEQGLGDELMFSSMIPDVLDALGPMGTLVLAVSPRLQLTFARSFPRAEVVALNTQVLKGRPVAACPPEAQNCALWAPLGSLAAGFRSRMEQFTPARGRLRPDPDAHALWADRLERLGPGLKVGICWKSLKTYGHRGKHYPPLAAWETLLRTKGVKFVNVQYGDCRAELDQFEAMGVSMFEPADLDRTNDLDGGLALSAALDLVVGVANASTAMAAAAGTAAWFILPPAPWPALGSERHPWYPNARAFRTERFGAWGPVFDALARTLALKAASVSEAGRD